MCSIATIGSFNTGYLSVTKNQMSFTIVFSTGYSGRRWSHHAGIFILRHTLAQHRDDAFLEGTQSENTDILYLGTDLIKYFSTRFRFPLKFLFAR